VIDDVRDSLPSYQDLIYPTLRAVDKLGGSGQAREVTAEVVSAISATEEQLALTYENRSKSVLIDRIDWARSYATLAGALERPKRGIYVLTPLGKSILVLPQEEGVERCRQLDREVRSSRRAGSGTKKGPPTQVDEPPVGNSDESWKEVLLARLHKLTPDGFEEFVLYLLRTFDMELKRVGGSGDEGIDGIGLAPISPVLSSRVAVQVKRYDPASAIGRDVVALFQRDAATVGAERAVLVTLGRFTAAARKAATDSRPTVNLIDGDRLCELVQKQEVGVVPVPTVIESWFDRFDSNLSIKK
jgi:restriction system protein